MVERAWWQIALAALLLAWGAAEYAYGNAFFSFLACAAAIVLVTDARP